MWSDWMYYFGEGYAELSYGVRACTSASGDPSFTATVDWTSIRIFCICICMTGYRLDDMGSKYHVLPTLLVIFIILGAFTRMPTEMLTEPQFSSGGSDWMRQREDVYRARTQVVMSLRKWIETKQQPGIATSSYQTRCCSVSTHFLSDNLDMITLQREEKEDPECLWEVQNSVAGDSVSRKRVLVWPEKLAGVLQTWKGKRHLRTGLVIFCMLLSWIWWFMITCKTMYKMASLL